MAWSPEEQKKISQLLDPQDYPKYILRISRSDEEGERIINLNPGEEFKIEVAGVDLIEQKDAHIRTQSLVVVYGIHAPQRKQLILSAQVPNDRSEPLKRFAVTWREE